MQTWIGRLHRVEDALLIALLGAMILLACAQIMLRNFFDSGFVWIDPLLRVMVLWLGLLGATVATRNNKHIRIDLLSKLLQPHTHRLVQVLVGQVSAWTCVIIAWYGFAWVRLDYDDGMIAFAGIPAWMLEIVVPLSFALIALRYFVLSFGWAKMCIEHWGDPGDTAA